MPSDLPIITPPPPPPPPPPRLTNPEKYGGLYYLGIGGLLFTVCLVAWFSASVWRLRGVWNDVYLLHDATQSEQARVQAAFRLARNQGVTERQRWDMAIRTGHPLIARYLLAESLEMEAVTPDPRGYGLAVARSPDWPAWFRWLIVRPMAYASGLGLTLEAELVQEIYEVFPESPKRLWVDYMVAEGLCRDTRLVDQAKQRLSAALNDPGVAELARLLRKSLGEQDVNRRARRLDLATRWMRLHDPDCRRVWDGWVLSEGQLARAGVRGDAAVPGTVSKP